MLSRIVLAALALVLLLPVAAQAENTLAPEAYAGEVQGRADTSPYIGVVDGYRPSTWMIGDSITAGGERYLRARGVRWEISAVPGRNVGTLPYRLLERQSNYRPVRVAIIALGTNATAGWTKENYRQAVAELPADAKKIFVTTYRDPRLWPSTKDYRRRAIIGAHYSRWMRELDREMANVCVADWRAYVEARYRVRTQLLRDGVHPTALGNVRWAALITNTVRNCR